MEKHPVIHLDFAKADYDTSAELKKSIMYRLERIAEEYGVDISQAYSPKTKLELLVEKLSVKEKVIVLINEFDKPIIDFIDDPRKARAELC